MGKDQIRQLISAESIRNRIAELGATITDDYANTSEILAICVLKGSFIFAADLIRQIDHPCRIEFIRASSYGSRRSSSGIVEFGHNIDLDISGRHLLLIEDIVDTALTITSITDELRKHAPASLKICTLLNKPSAREIEIGIDYTGFTIPDLFVVGYGLDDAEQHRQLPFIGVDAT